MWTLPNILTLSRIALIPVVLLFVYIQTGWAAYAAITLYALLALTDYFDGKLARSMNAVSPLGTFLDPIADKIFVAAILLVLVDVDILTGIWTLAAIVIMVREFVVSGLREFLGPLNIKVPVTILAKWKTTVQMIALGFLILAPVHAFFLWGGRIGIVVAAVITVKTGWDYLSRSWPHLKGPAL